MVDVIDDTQPITINVWICEDFSTQSECLAHGCYWYNESCHSSLPACNELNNEPDCSAYGCYWWDNACHPTPKPEGVANITDITSPQSIQSGTPFNITYTITNLGAADTLWAGLYDLLGNPIAGVWSEPFAAGEIKIKTIDFPNGITTSLEGVIQAGHVEE